MMMMSLMIDDDVMIDDMMMDDDVMIDDMMMDDDVMIADGDTTGINTPPQTPPLTVMDTPLGWYAGGAPPRPPQIRGSGGVSGGPGRGSRF